MHSQSQSAAATQPVRSVARVASLTVAQLADRYMAAYDGRDDQRVHRVRWWVDRIGDRPVIEVTDDELFHLLEELAARPARVYAGKDADGRRIFRTKANNVTPATVNRYQHCLAAMFTWAIRKRLMPREWTSPCTRLERRRENNERVRFLSDAERARLLEACRASRWPRLYVLALMAITTGARRGELMRLRVGDIELNAAVARLTVTKNGDSRVLPLVPTVVEELRRVMPERADALVFGSTRNKGAVYHLDSVWHTALKAAKVKDFRFHDLRHCCASYLAQNGATLLEIADVLGHRQLSVTKRYSHLTVQHKAALVHKVLGHIR